MDHRPLGATGVQPIHLCRDAMKLGARGDTDHARCARTVPTALAAAAAGRRS